MNDLMRQQNNETATQNNQNEPSLSADFGKKVAFLLKRNNEDVANFCRQMGISRSSMHRYIKGTHLPSDRTMTKIIDGLRVTPEQFQSIPGQYEEWETAISAYGEPTDFFELCQSILNELHSRDLCYTTRDDITKRLPRRQYAAFCNLFNDAVEMMRVSLNV